MGSSGDSGKRKTRQKPIEDKADDDNDDNDGNDDGDDGSDDEDNDDGSDSDYDSEEDYEAMKENHEKMRFMAWGRTGTLVRAASDHPDIQGSSALVSISESNHTSFLDQRKLCVVYVLEAEDGDLSLRDIDAPD